MTIGKTLRIGSVLAGLVACGGGGDGASEKVDAAVDAAVDDTQKFLGTWTYTTGDVTVTCPNLPILGNMMPKIPLSNQTFTIGKGTAAPLLYTRVAEMGMACEIDMDAKGAEATARPGKTCKFKVTVQNFTVDAQLTFDSWKLTSADGLTGTTQGTGKVSGMFLNMPIMCTATETGTTTKGAAATGDAGR